MTSKENPDAHRIHADFKRVPPISGLVLSGGSSTRMQHDKGDLVYHGTSQRQHLYDLLTSYCNRTFISCNRKQAADLEGKFPLIIDSFTDLGPLNGILSAFQSDPDVAWLTVACDLPYLSAHTLDYLNEHRNPSKTATAFLDPQGEFPEPLITIWEPKIYPVLLQYMNQGIVSPRKILVHSEVELLKAPDKVELENVNYPGEYEAAIRELKSRHSQT